MKKLYIGENIKITKKIIMKKFKWKEHANEHKKIIQIFGLTLTPII